MRSVLVPGEPALWSAGADKRSIGREEDWKLCVSAALHDQISEPNCVLLQFSVGAWTRRGQRFDLDNLVTPVFRAMYGNSNRDRTTARAALSSWRAIIAQSSAPFLLIDLLDYPLCDIDSSTSAQCIIDATWTGPLPTDSRAGDAGLGAWVSQQAKGFSPSDASRFAVQLTFGAAVSDISRPEEKPIKPVIDCLYPVFGGGPGRGEDWKKVLLQVERGRNLSGSCHIRCLLLPSGPALPVQATH